MRRPLINMNKALSIAGGLITLGILLAVIIFLMFKVFSHPNIFLNTYQGAAVESAWLIYRDTIQKDGRTIDRDRNYLTTSEGQSYSLLRAVWMDDQEIFERSYRWTKNNLQKRETDRLFHWLWGQDAIGRWGILTDIGGRNTASDADQDIALALIFAAKRWDNNYYMEEALEILNDIWEVEVMNINGRPYLLAGNWAREEARPTINPSYLSPAAYTIFAQVDPAHDWLALKATSYEILDQATFNPLDKQSAVGLPPDWVSINPVTGKIEPPMHADKTTNFSDDAFRTLWRVALDYHWHQDPRAAAYLQKITFLEEEWQSRGLIYGTYTHDGRAVKSYESSSLYGVVLAFFKITNPQLAKEVYDKKISQFYNSDLETLRADLGYYPQNWVWFGMAFYADKLPDLSVIE